MTKLPKQVRILGRTFKVKKMPQTKVQELTGTASALAGMCFTGKLIIIADHMTKEDEMVSFYHECVHVAQYIAGLNQITPADLAEVWCEVMANMMYDLSQVSKK